MSNTHIKENMFLCTYVFKNNNKKTCSYVLMSKNIMCLCPNEPQPESYSCLRMLQKQLAIPTAHPISPTTFSTNVKKKTKTFGLEVSATCQAG